MGTIIKIFLFLVIMFIGVGAFALYSLGVIGSPKPIDLGIKYSTEDFKAVQQKSGVEHIFVDIKEPTQAVQYEGEHKVKDSFTSQEVTAAANEKSWSLYPFSNVQIKVGDEIAEASGNLDTEKLISYLESIGRISSDEAEKIRSYIPITGNPSFYINAAGNIKNGKVSLHVKSLKIGPISIPGNIISQNTSRVEGFIESSIENYENVDVDLLEFKENLVNFEGTLPDIEKLAR